jgi:hypothetical protein
MALMPRLPRIRRRVAGRRAHLAVVRPPAARPRGRAWINGREIGGAPACVAHLARGYD